MSELLPVIETRQVSKHFGRVVALSQVDFAVYPGEIVGLVGDNGAGKSTLVKILAGALQPSSGDVRVDGRRVVMSSPLDSRSLGIETVYQDLALALHLSIAANVFLGREERSHGILGRLGWRDDRAMENRARTELDALGITIPSVTVPCEALSGGQRQAVAVARAIAWGSHVILMDEPTASLGVAEQGQVAHLVRQIRDRGIPVLVISHNLPQVHSLADRIVVLRHGQIAAELDPRATSVEDIVMHITGAAIGQSAA